MPIERDEFQHAVGLIRDDIRGVHDRLDALNGRTRTNEANIIRLQERVRVTPRSHKVVALGSFSGVIALVVEAAKLWFVK